MIQKDLIIVGSGPAGLRAGREAQKAGIDYLIIEGGEVAQAWKNVRHDMPLLSPCHPQRDWTSISSEFPIWKLDVTRPFCVTSEFVNYLIKFYEHFNLNIIKKTYVKEVEKKNDLFVLKTLRDEYQSKYLLIATGFFGNPFIPDIEGIKSNPKVSHSHYFKSAEKYKSKRVIIVGGGNSAAEIAIELAGNSQVYLITRDNLKFFSKTKNLCHIRGISESLLLELISMELIRYISKTNIKKIEKNIIYLDNECLEADEIIFATGYRPVLELIKNNRISINNHNQFPIVQKNGESSDITNLFFGGPLAYQRLSSLFIHGFTKNITLSIAEIKKRLN